MKLYIIDFWIPFPSSEYGGVIIVTANTEEEVIELLINHKEIKYNYHPSDNNIEKIKEAVKDATVYEISGNHTPNIVKTFLT